MKAMVVTKYGPPDGLKIKEIEKPSPKDNEVLIKIHASTVTFGDAMLRSFGFLQRLLFGLFFGLKKDKILGHEFAGVVEETGKSVTRFQVGDQVFASSGFKSGAYAEYICIAEEKMIALKPVNMSFQQAAAVPVGGNTALHILRQANIQPGQKVLVYGASGSVGTYAVQLAKHFGAHVTAVCGTANQEFIRDLGADEAIDYTKEDFNTQREKYDVIFDAVRKLSPAQYKQSLKENGRYLSSSASTKESPSNLEYLKALIEAGEISAVIDRVYRFEQIPDAHKYVDQGHKKGNVVISVVDEPIE